MVAKPKVVVEEEGETEERKPQTRVSISLDPSLRKQLRIAAAVHDMTVGEYCIKVLEKASEAALKQT